MLFPRRRDRGAIAGWAAVFVALGALLGGTVIAAGYGWTAPAAVGAGLSVLGLGVVVASHALERRDARRTVAPDAAQEPVRVS